MTQTLLFPDPRPLVERLGIEFFRQAPQCPGVYLMRDATDTVLYVGKAKNLRKRLASYRVANPERMPRRHLRLLRAVERIELRECEDESAAIATESGLLRVLRPRFNRAGTWPGTRRLLAWRAAEDGLDLAVTESIETGWLFHPASGSGVVPLLGSVVRLLWCAIHPERGLMGMPAGWFQGRLRPRTTIRVGLARSGEAKDCAARLSGLFNGQVVEFAEWVRERSLTQTHPFEIAVRENDLEVVMEFVQNHQITLKLLPRAGDSSL